MLQVVTFKIERDSCKNNYHFATCHFHKPCLGGLKPESGILHNHIKLLDLKLPKITLNRLNKLVITLSDSWLRFYES